jgi:hypothetical protein
MVSVLTGMITGFVVAYSLSHSETIPWWVWVLFAASLIGNSHWLYKKIGGVK